MQEILKKLRELTGHEQVVLTPNGNTAILHALMKVEKKKVLIPDQGGWLTYKNYPTQLGRQLIEVKTVDALIDLEDLKAKIDKDAVLLYENPGGYFVEQPIKEIYDLCKKAGAVVILDASGGVGTDMCDGRYADSIVGSFGKWKPVNAEYGGFISSNKEYDFDSFDIDESKLSDILDKLEKLPERIKFLNDKRTKVIEDIKKYDIVHPQSRGYVVVVKGTDEQLEEVKEYCKKNGLEWTECPRYIRLMSKAVSIEVKRL